VSLTVKVRASYVPQTKEETSMLRKIVAFTMLTVTLAFPLASPVQAKSPTKTCWNNELVTLAYFAGWPPQEIPKVMRTMYKESRCNTFAKNSCCSGLMQIHKLHLKRLHMVRNDLYIPFDNLVAAHDVWVRAGWKAWTGGGA